MPVSFMAGTMAGAVAALVLGLSTGPVCLASCGPAVAPWLLAQPKGIRSHTRQLTVFLAARLAAYLLFATAVWETGAAMEQTWTSRAWAGWAAGAVDLLLAVALLIYAAGWPRLGWRPFRRKPQLIQIGAPQERRIGAVALGFLTGINLCPPFLVVGLQAARQANLAAALVYFLFFFVGTAVWFAPFAALGLVKRPEGLVFVARVTAALLAAWYGLRGLMLLLERSVYG